MRKAGLGMKGLDWFPVQRLPTQSSFAPLRKWCRSQVAARALAAILVAGVLSGCGATNATSGARPSAIPPLSPSPLAIPTATPTATPVPTPTPTRGPSGFSMTGHMKDFRWDFTATLLLDGRVLVAGGMNTGGGSAEVLATAELYDPATGRFTPTGSMAEARQDSTATLLPDGRVLIVGGFNEATMAAKTGFAEAELYDPAVGTFSRLELPGGFNAWSATPVLDGHVLLLGGQGSIGHWVSVAELYDPTTNRFTATGAFPEILAETTVTALLDGRVLVAGGYDAAGTAHGSAYLFDPTTGRWSATGSMTQARHGHAAVELHDGRVLIVGGVTGPYCASPIEEAAETYDPKTGKFSATGSLLQVPGESGRSSTVVVLADGKVLVAGGDTCEGVSTLSKTAEIYDPATGGFTYTKPMADGFAAADGVLLADGRVLIVGGLAAHSGVAVSRYEAELYQP